MSTVGPSRNITSVNTEEKEWRVLTPTAPKVLEGCEEEPGREGFSVLVLSISRALLKLLWSKYHLGRSLIKQLRGPVMAAHDFILKTHGG